MQDYEQRAFVFCCISASSLGRMFVFRCPVVTIRHVRRVDAIASWSSPCHYERSFSFVILNGAAGGVKDLRYDNLHEMCPPDSSLSLRMTEA